MIFDLGARIDQMLARDMADRVYGIAVTPVRQLELQLLVAISERYGGSSPVRVVVSEHPVLSGVRVVVSIPGQTREIVVSSLQMSDLTTHFESVLDEVLFAVFLLMDEDEDFNDD